MENKNQSNLKSNNIKMVNKKIVFKIKKTQPKQNIKMSISNKKTPIKKVNKSIIKKNKPINIKDLKSNKRDILKVLNYKSITEAYKDFGLKKGDISVNDLYEILINNYNSDLKYKKEQKLKKQLLQELPKFIKPPKKIRKYEPNEKIMLNLTIKLIYMKKYYDPETGEVYKKGDIRIIEKSYIIKHKYIRDFINSENYDDSGKSSRIIKVEILKLSKPINSIPEEHQLLKNAFVLTYSCKDITLY